MVFSQLLDHVICENAYAYFFWNFPYHYPKHALYTTSLFCDIFYSFIFFRQCNFKHIFATVYNLQAKILFAMYCKPYHIYLSHWWIYAMKLFSLTLASRLFEIYIKETIAAMPVILFICSTTSFHNLTSLFGQKRYGRKCLFESV